MTEIILQVLYCVLIIAAVFLVAVLWRLFNILSKFQEMADILEKRTKELDEGAQKIKSLITSWIEVIKGVLSSLNFIKDLKNKISSLGGEKDE